MPNKLIVGAPVWYHPGPGDAVAKRSDQPLHGHIVHANDDGSVNLVVFDPVGDHFPIRDAKLFDGDGERPENGFAEWPDESPEHRPKPKEAPVEFGRRSNLMNEETK